MGFFSKINTAKVVGDAPRGRKILKILIIILIVITVFQGLGTVRAGQRGVHLRFGAVTGKIFDEGLYFKIPFIDDVQIISVKIIKFKAKADAASRDLQTVAAEIALNYHIEPSKTGYIYQNIGPWYEDELIAPAIQEVVKAATALFTAEELITKRTAVREEMRTNLKNKLDRHGIKIDEFNVENFNFSEAFDEAVELKVTAEQQALAAQNKLEQIKFEAQQKIEAAKGSAEAIRIEAQALSQNPQILQLRAIEKWDGILPKVTGGEGTIPFIDIK